MGRFTDHGRFQGLTDADRNKMVTMRDRPLLEISVVPEHWGNIKSEDVNFLLNNVAQNFLGCFRTPFFARLRVQCQPNRLTGKVECSRWFNFKHKHRITLCTGDCCQWSFQFAHEICHILLNYDRVHCFENAWFHEALCDLAAIFTVRQMAKSWTQAHPLGWTWFSIAIQQYSQALMMRRDFQLPNNLTFPIWFKTNECSLRADRYQRGKNGLIAVQLVPIMESNPENWEGIRFLPDSSLVFELFLSEWEQRCPQLQKPFVRQIIKVFGFSKCF
jgi:hypothetical protein